MIPRGLFQTLPFCDSVILSSINCVWSGESSSVHSLKNCLELINHSLKTNDFP